MKTRLLILTMFCAGLLHAQQFQKKTVIKLPAILKPSQVRWADIDNDSLLDVVIGDTSQQKLSVMTVSGLFHGPAKITKTISSPYQTGRFTIADLNADDKLDLVITGSNPDGTTVFLNNGNQNFGNPYTLPVTGNQEVIFSDFNNDGNKDILWLGNSQWHVLKASHGNFLPALKSTTGTTEDINVFDFDKNGFPDIAISGKDNNGQPFFNVICFKNLLDTLRFINVPTSFAGKITTGDINHDGLFDVIIFGKDGSGNGIIQEFINTKNNFTPGKKWIGITATDVLIADFTSDGKADISVTGQDQSGNRIHWIKTFEGDSITLNSSGVLQEAFGDFDRDGDLDLVQINDTTGLVLWENIISVKNQKPFEPSGLTGEIFYNRFFMYWDAAVDDHTFMPAISYDLSVYSGTGTIFGAEYDNKNFTRLTVSNGNQGTNNYGLFRLTPVHPAFDVQAIDNAFVGSAPTTAQGNGGIATGGNGVCVIKHQNISVCQSAPITLIPDNTSVPSLWFSFSDGYVTSDDTLNIPVAATDTVFSFAPHAESNGCPAITLFLIDVTKDNPVKITKDYNACAGSIVTLMTDDQWQNQIWTLNAESLGSGKQLDHLVSGAETITTTAQNANGCSLLQTNNIHPLHATVTLTGEVFKIMFGQSVQLGASGGVSYQWTPPTGLENPDSPTPTASPLSTTNYTVTMTDSAGCKATGSVKVEVSEIAFIATLFTPNGDGRNETLKVYGLTHAQQFRLTIYNREGAVVYETGDVGSASVEGWNGTYNGSLQPSGLYYWKVEGRSDTGESVQLNGKKQGSVFLVR